MQRIRYVNAGAKAAVVITDNEAVGRSREAELRSTRFCLLWRERFAGKTGDAKLTAVSLSPPSVTQPLAWLGPCDTS